MKLQTNLVVVGLIRLLMSVYAEAQVNQRQDFSEVLHEAVTNGDLQKVLSAIKSGANVNANKYIGTMKYSWTPLHEAVAKGYVEIAKALIENGANVNTKNNFGWSVLHEAAGKNKNVKLAQLLIENGAKVNITNNGGETPLKRAVFMGNVEVARILIANGATVNLSAKDEAGNTLLDYAKSEEMKALLLKPLAESVKLQDADGSNKESVQTTGVINGDGVRLRSSMDKMTKANIIDKFAKGTQVEILEHNGEWLKVRVNGKVGYMFAEFVEY